MANAQNTPSADFSAAIARIKRIAAQSGDALLLAAGLPHPDMALLDLCAEIAQARQDADAAFQRRCACRPATWMAKSHEEAVEIADAKREDEKASKQYSHLLRRAAKIKATTAAGIYAKALAVRSSRTGSALLAASMAEDLLARDGLRASLWPTEAGGVS